MVPVWFWAALYSLRTAARRSCPMPLAVSFFSGFAIATNPSTMFLIASMSEGEGERGGVGGPLECRDWAGPPPLPSVGGVGAVILSHAKARALRGSGAQGH
ncbi:hypothetical protein N657DRAFT_106470 [Parathielavia appendiculata]|uniref:Uncharacterized protein n=1 Tax=Parathielavia appendiculata TaxID=2587402 RepID=A0AAN6TX07_9PEZI|nr:hypothetical protein N657DRAFT_106470 [Parathielavia appendiculata]